MAEDLEARVVAKAVEEAREAAEDQAVPKVAGVACSVAEAIAVAHSAGAAEEAVAAAAMVVPREGWEGRWADTVLRAAPVEAGQATGAAVWG